MKTYTVEYRSFDGDDVMAFESSVRADTMHDAVGQAWPGLKKNVESYGGTIDDLVAWESEPDPVHSDGDGIRTLSETRDEFEDRIGRRGAAVVIGSLPWESLPASSMRFYTDVALIGYAEALRDIRGLAGREDVVCLVPDDIAQFAAARGIDLEEQP